MCPHNSVRKLYLKAPELSGFFSRVFYPKVKDQRAGDQGGRESFAESKRFVAQLNWANDSRPPHPLLFAKLCVQTPARISPVVVNGRE